MKGSLRNVMLLFLLLAVFTFPLFGQSQKALTRDLGKMIENRKIDIATARSLLEHGADPNGTLSGYHYDNMTFLMGTVGIFGLGGFSLTKLLLEYGADPNIRNSNGDTAAHYTAGSYSEEILVLLTAKGARFDITNKQGESPLMYYISRDYNYTVEGVAFILDWEEQNSPGFSAQFENRKDYLTPILERLLYHVYFRHVDNTTNYFTLIEKLIDDGASLNALNYKGETVLYNAALKGNVEQVNYLLSKGADPNRQNRSGETALMAGQSPEIINLLLEFEANPNLQDKSGKTALMAKQSPEKISLLLEFGADPNLQDMEGNTVMMEIGRFQWGRTVEDRASLISLWKDLIYLLLDAEADPTIKNSSGQTVLHRWYHFLDDPLLDTLISRGCLIDEPDNEGTTLLMLDAQDDSGWRITAALERGADPNLRDSEGRTAFHYYMLEVEKRWYREDWDYEPITSFLAAGARPGFTDNKGDSALSVAIRLSNIYLPITPLLDMMLQQANDDEIKAAEAMAGKMAAKERLGYFSKSILKILPPILIVLIIGGLSIGMRKGVYRNNPSENWMGWVNGILLISVAITAVVTAVGFVLFEYFGIYFFLVVWPFCLLAGIILNCILPSIGKTLNDYASLYYLPTVISVIAAIYYIVNLQN